MVGGDGAGMSEITDFYQQQALAGRSNIPWLSDLQKTALTDFERFGFPTRQHEEWKYTSVVSFLQQRFSTTVSAVAMPMTARYQTDIPVGHLVGLINGEVCGAQELMAKLPEGVVVQSLAQALVDHPDKISPYLGCILQHEHGFHALNTAMLHQGLFIYLPAGVSLSEPLLLVHWQDVANQATHIRHLVVAEKGSSASIIEDYQGDASSCYLTNTVTEVFTATDAKLTHYKIQRESKQAYHVGHIAVKQAAGSQFDSHLFSVGGKLVRNDMTIYLQEPGAHCLMNGIYGPTDGQHMDQHTTVFHEVPDCSSEQDYKGILTGRSRGVFNGKVIVAKNAQHTRAKQQNKNLLLSATAEIDTKPQLDIYADDVVCTHGATVGQLDEDALFYLAARGIGRLEASQYLIQAFATENLRAIPLAGLATWMSTILEGGCYE